MKTGTRHRNWITRLTLTLGLLAAAASILAAQAVPSVTIDWSKKTPSHTTPTLQTVVNPMTRRGSPIHDASLEALHHLGADYVRYAFWIPYPRLAVAELRPPTATETFWDFQYLDPLVEDFMRASDGHPAVFCFSTVPQWLFKTAQPVSYPEDPNEVAWNYSQGSDLPDLKALGDYYARLASWYTKGGFTDELGKFHSSGHHYDIRYWEIFNEPEYEHGTTAEQYVERYDAIALAVHKVAPEIKFVGLSLAVPREGERMFEYFLDPKNHKPGVPLDYISFHFYAVPTADQTVEHWQHTFFDQADGFLVATRFALKIRDRLSPGTKIMINEAGSILAGDLSQGEAGHIEQPVPAAYWNLSGAMYAYLYVELAKLGVDVVGESQLIGYPTQFPSVSMVDWNTGKPNARFTVLALLKNNFGPGDDMAETNVKDNNARADASGVTAQAFSSGAKRKLLLINKRNREIVVDLPKEFAGSAMQSIGGGSSEIVAQALDRETVRLTPFSVSVVTLKP